MLWNGATERFSKILDLNTSYGGRVSPKVPKTNTELIFEYWTFMSVHDSMIIVLYIDSYRQMIGPVIKDKFDG